MKDAFPVLYVMVRPKYDLNSMGSGKAEAHSGHASNAFVERAIVKPLLKGKKPDELAMDWRQATTQGFGTQINLLADFKQMSTVVEVATKLGYISELVTDPTYPYFLNPEAASLVPESTDTLPRMNKGTEVLMFRKEVTAAYVFGDKNDPILSAIVGNFKLKPEQTT